MTVKTAASSAVATAPAKPEREQGRGQRPEEHWAVSAVAYSIVASPAERHPNSKERTDNLQAMYAELTKKPPEKTVAALSVH